MAGTGRRLLLGLLAVVSLYFVLRALVEPFVIDFGDPASYRADWGGPSLVGVLAVHCLPGVAGAAYLVALWRRRPGAGGNRGGRFRL